jgi:nitrilase
MTGAARNKMRVMTTQPASDPGPTVRVAAVQMVSGIALDANLRAAGELIAQAAAAGAELVVLPEYFCLMGARDGDKVALREPDGRGPIQDFLAGQARRHGLWLVGGTLPMAASTPQRVRNTVLVFDPQGRRAARYDKIHLFSFSQATRATTKRAPSSPAPT